MFACLYLPPLARNGAPDVLQLARDFSPRVETHGPGLVTLDIQGLGSLLGDARAIGEELRGTAADRGLRVHVAIAATTTAAILLAQSRAGLVVIPAGEEAQALASLPISALDTFAAPGGSGCRVPGSGFAAPNALRGSGCRVPGSGFAVAPDAPVAPHAPNAPVAPIAPVLSRWGLRTLGDLAALPSADLSERLGQQGLLWQRWARGQDARPLVPASVEEGFEETLELEWPIEGLEPLSFVLARLFDPLCERLEQHDRGAVVLHVTLTLVTKERHERSLQLPAPMRDARVLRTLALLDLESHPPAAAIDRVTVGVEVTEGRVLQFGLFARALPAERLATLMARLGALMGDDRVGAPALVDSHRPGAFAMAKFEPLADRESLRSSGRSLASGAESWGWGPTSTKEGSPRALKDAPKAPAFAPGGATAGKHPAIHSIVRRFRSPIPARVTVEQGRPVRVITDRRGFTGGAVTRCDGPWRSSGDWWLTAPNAPRAPFAPHAPSKRAAPHAPWDCDEWDVTLSDGASYRISRTDIAGASRDQLKDAWFIDGILD